MATLTKTSIKSIWYCGAEIKHSSKGVKGRTKAKVASRVGRVQGAALGSQLRIVQHVLHLLCAQGALLEDLVLHLRALVHMKNA